MSTESSASETTPLRRPESSLSDDHSASSPNATFLPNSDFQQNLTSDPPTPIHIRRNHLRFATTTTTTNINNNNTNNDRENNNYNTNMDTNQRVVYRIVIDVVILLCVGFPILLFFLLGSPYERGFFCDDESLMHPFKQSTVATWMLYIIGLVIPVGTMLTVEILRSQHQTKRSNGNNIAKKYILYGYEIPDWLVESYKKVGVFGFGAAASQLVTDIAKYSIGRLRPHFFAVCQPLIMPGETTCQDPSNMGKYITNFRCLGIGSTEKMLKEVRLSFPSGHSSFTFFTMVYVALYLQSRWHWKGSKLLRHVIQFGLILIAWFTALSRVSDYKHHWSDVLAGSAIGALVAIIVAKYVSDLFVEQPKKSYMLPRTTQDIGPQGYTTNGH